MLQRQRIPIVRWRPSPVAVPQSAGTYIRGDSRKACGQPSLTNRTYLSCLLLEHTNSFLRINQFSKICTYNLPHKPETPPQPPMPQPTPSPHTSRETPSHSSSPPPLFPQNPTTETPSTPPSSPSPPIPEIHIPPPEPYASPALPARESTDHHTRPHCSFHTPYPTTDISVSTSIAAAHVIQLLIHKYDLVVIDRAPSVQAGCNVVTANPVEAVIRDPEKAVEVIEVLSREFRLDGESVKVRDVEHEEDKGKVRKCLNGRWSRLACWMDGCTSGICG
ncbi:hypothetical protein M011DRAFT_498680 [Sporormia fimetaria CBS 119925]|uniref:Uncharacterized protein n=1 Tax=Sporormia fimetaria CBS 119925 TaxID=1340428 RepID=A0A6A6VNN3_9PLEO|nr:hypothetical protein M011DRAFT_498680 [Sporormia fimetaria CBS 119925]